MLTQKIGTFYGTAADISISLGFIPDRVEIHNQTDGTSYYVGFPSRRVIAFTSGGTNEIKVGHKIIGATSGATGRVIAIHADTGTWAAGTAAGNLILDADTETGTFASENAYYYGSDGTNDCAVAASADMGFDVDTEVAAFTNITAYKGTTTAEKGFTLKAASSTDAKMFVYTATRDTSD